ncbi:MAG: phenylacetic acid degradation protein PaaN [Sulfuritalea sp.]|nr:phenylacetic acid degradation protein PaaN [Sulfuritalea sp.]
MPHPMFEKHQTLLQQAVAAIETRGYWSPYAENPRVYGDTAVEDGRQAFEAYRGAQFYLDQPGVIARGGAEVSPYGLPLNISYPRCAADALIAAAKSAMPAWIKAGADARAGICAEILARLNARSFEMAHAVMHTTGQALMMAFQAAGPHAQDRGLEAVAYAWREMKQVPGTALWEKPQGKNPPLKMEKTFTVMPRGVALVIACSTFPTWNGYPGIFASLVTGNPVIVKAHPTVILPLAISVAVARQVLKEAGFDPNLVSLLVDDAAAPVAKDVAMNPDVRLIDYTGGPDFGNWLEEHCRHALVYTEKAGVNCIVVDSIDDYPAMLKNLAFTLSLYSGQMCTTPQTIFVSGEGVKIPDGVVSAEQFGRDLANAVSQFLENPARAVEILGAIQSPATLARLEAAHGLGEVLRASGAVVHPHWPEARVRSPLILRVAASDERAYMEERFGPITLVVETATTAQSLATAERVIREQGAITFAVYSTNPLIVEHAEEAALRVGVALSINLTGGVFVNQSAGFSDFHATGANPAANACLTDSAFVAGRFFVVQSRRHV